MDWRRGEGGRSSSSFAGLLISLIGFSFGEVYTLDPEGIYPSEGWFVGAAHDPKYRRPLRILLGGGLFFARGSRLATGSAWPLRLREHAPSFVRALIPVAAAGLLVCFPVFSLALRELLPGLAGLRVLSRAFVLVLTALAAFAVLGLDDLRRTLGHRIGATAGSATAIALVLLMSFESRPRITWHRTPDPAASTNLDNLLKESDEVVAIAEFPTGRLPHNQALIMYRSINHWKPIVNGYSGTIPSLTREILGRGRLPSPEGIARMRELGLSHLLVPEEASDLGYLRWTSALARFSRRSAQLGLEHEITLDGVRVYRIRGSSQPAEREP